MRATMIVWVMILSTIFLSAQAPPVYEVAAEFEAVNAEQESYTDLYDYTRIIVDRDSSWNYLDILRRSDDFAVNRTRTEKDLRKVYWVKLALQSSVTDSFLFSVGKLYEDHNLVDIYYEMGDTVVHQRSGYAIRPAEKTIRRSGSYFWIYLQAKQIRNVYIRVDNIYRDCYCWEKSPISVYHIDDRTIKYEEATYVLRDLSLGQNVPRVKGARAVDLVRYFEFYPDPSCQLNLEEVRQDWDQQSYFRGYKPRDLPLDTCHWLRLRVINPADTAQIRTFAYEFNRWHSIEYYLSDEEGHFRRYEAFPNEQDQRAFTLNIEALDTLTLYIRYPKRTNSFAFTGSMYDVHPADLIEKQKRAKYKYLFVGMILFLLLYFSLQLLVNWDQLLFYYLVMLLGLTPFFMISLDHTAFFSYSRSVYMIPEVATEYLLNLARLLALIGILKFTQVTLDLSVHLPRHYKIFQWILGANLLLWLLITVVWTLDWSGYLQTTLCLYCTVLNIYTLFGGLVCGLLVFTAIVAFLKRIPLSTNFLIALLPVSLSIFWNSFLSVFIYPEFEIFGPFIIGLSFTLLLFSILIGARSHRLQEERVEAERQKMLLQNQLLQIELKALRAQMNPHFIFNCLNSIKSLIQESANKQAVHYLTLFSKFIRKVLQYSEEKHITLEEELEISRLYLEMEKLRFDKSFNYQIRLDPAVDTSFFQVPPMILQPYLENAIWHGLMHKSGERILHLEVCQEGDAVKCIVEDNGIGREKAALLNAHTRGPHRSFGTRLSQDRLQINKTLFDSHFVIQIIDKVFNGSATGTRVELSLSETNL